MNEMKKINNNKFKKYFKNEEWQVITTLRNNKDIVIKQADTGGNIVIKNKQNCLQKGLTQLSNNSHYDLLEEDPNTEMQQPNTSGTTTSYKPQHCR